MRKLYPNRMLLFLSALLQRVCWQLVLVILLLSGLSSRSQAQTSGEIAWLNQQLHPLTSLVPGPPATELAAFLAQAAPARLVGLGECTHGSREVFQLKHRLLTALVEQQHYTVFAIEADFTGAQRVNDYVQTGAGDSLKILDALGYWTWYTQEVWELIKWMRAYNQVHPHALTFRGFDMNYPFFALRALEQFTRQQSDTTATAWVAELQKIYRGGARLSKSPQRQARQLSFRLGKWLRPLPASPNLRQSVLTLAQYARMRSKGAYFANQFRDQCMARNIDWLVQQHPAEKLVLWAHNGHIEKRGGLSKSMGHYLAQTYGTSYLATGFATGHGTYTAVSMDTAGHRHLTRTNVLMKPVTSSAERWLMQASVPDFYLTLRDMAWRDPASVWLRQKRHFRSIGSTVPTQPAYQFTPTCRVSQVYDILIYLQQTSASQCLLAK